MKDRIRNVVDDNDTDADLDKKLKKHSTRKRTVKIVLAVAVFAIVAVVYIFQKQRIYTEYGIDKSWEMGDMYDSKVYSFGKYLLKYSDDGIVCMDENENIWNQAFEMSQPLLDINGNYGAVCQKSSNKIYIFNDQGVQGKIETDYPVVNLDVSKNGVVAVITEEKTEVCHTEIIDKSGTVIAKGQTVMAGDGCPVDLSISDDGTKLVVSYISVTNGNAQSKIVFYNYSEIGKNEVDRFVGGFNYESSVMVRVEFLDNDHVAAFGDNVVSVYSVKQKPSKIKDISVDERINSILYSDSYIALITENDTADKMYTIKVYDTAGELKKKIDTDIYYTGAVLDGDTIVLNDDKRLVVYGISGSEKFNGEISGGIDKLFSTGERYTYTIIKGNKAKKISLK